MEPVSCIYFLDKCPLVLLSTFITLLSLYQLCGRECQISRLHGRREILPGTLGPTLKTSWLVSVTKATSNKVESGDESTRIQKLPTKDRTHTVE